jgi:hypothetical protein
MKNKDIYACMIKHRPVWVTYPPKEGTLMKCQVVMVGRIESLLRADCGAEFTTSNRNISDKRPVR